MSRTRYQIYQEQVFVLAKSIVVKHEEIAASMNQMLSYSGHYSDLDADQPYHWRYYLNLSGQYHQYDIDTLNYDYGTPTLMIPIATNNGTQEVAFTKDLIWGANGDINIANEYKIGSNLYNNLVQKYPDYEQLINGIINPIDITTAISANDGEILYVDGLYKIIDGEVHYFAANPNLSSNKLIEPQEQNLLDELQRWITNYKTNWVNGDYIDGNDLYVPIFLAVFYSQLPNVIMNIRLGNCKTQYAHSFHITQYLQSNGQLGQYVQFMPIETALWLYRNAVWLESNKGKQGTFGSIINNVFTPNKIPMQAWNTHHQLNKMDSDNLLPTAMFYKEVVNFEVYGASDDDRTVMDILEQEVPLARDNPLDLDDKNIAIQSAIDWAGDDKLNTKVLESEMMDLGDPYPFTLESICINLWAYTALKGYYTGTIYFTHPITGDDVGLTPLNAYIMAMYCLTYGMTGVQMINIPNIHLYNIPRTNNPSDYPTDTGFSPLPSLDTALSWVDQSHTRKLKVAEVIGTFTPNFVSKTAKDLFNNAQDVYHERVRKYNAYCNTEDFHERGDLNIVYNRCYWDNFKESLGGGNYPDFFNMVGVDLTGLDPDDIYQLGLTIITAATGYDEFANLKEKWLQNAAMAVIQHYSSYTVQYIKKFADGTVAYLDGQTLRYSDWQWNYKGMLPEYYSLRIEYNSQIRYKFKSFLDIGDGTDGLRINLKPTIKADYDLSGLVVHTGREVRPAGVYEVGLNVFNLAFNERIKLYDDFPSPPDEVDVYGARYIVSDIYYTPFPNIPPPSYSLSSRYIDSGLYQIIVKDGAKVKIGGITTLIKDYPILTGDRYTGTSVDTVSGNLLVTIKYTSMNYQDAIRNPTTYNNNGIESYTGGTIDAVSANLVVTIKYTSINYQDPTRNPTNYNNAFIESYTGGTIDSVSAIADMYPFSKPTPYKEGVGVSIGNIGVFVSDS